MEDTGGGEGGAGMRNIREITCELYVGKTNDMFNIWIIRGTC